MNFMRRFILITLLFSLALPGVCLASSAHQDTGMQSGNSSTVKNPYWIHLDPAGNHTLEENFTITGSTNLPAGYPVMAEIFPGWYSFEKFKDEEYYESLIKEIISTSPSGDGNTTFSLTVNLSGHHTWNNIPLRPGDYWIEAHAVNMNSTVSDTAPVTLSTDSPWILIDPIPEPVRGTNMTLSGTTNLPEGKDLFLSLNTHRMVPCGRYGDSDPETICGGCTCSYVSISRSVPIQNATNSIRSWKYNVSTENWCLHESYKVQVSAGEQKDAAEDQSFFNIHET